MIDPGFWNDSRIVALSIPARLLYIGLWQYADDEGFFLDDLPAIKRTLFPDQKFDIQATFSELHGFLTEYSVSPHGKAYAINHFLDWQKLNRPTPSKIRPLCILTEPSLSPHEQLTEPSLSPHSEEKRREVNRREDTLSSTSDEQTLTVKDFVESWNENFKGSLPQVSWPLSASRARKVAARIKEHADATFWETVFGNIDSSPFLMGRAQNGNGHETWRCTMDWLVENDRNCLKVFEGQYNELAG